MTCRAAVAFLILLLSSMIGMEGARAEIVRLRQDVCYATAGAAFEPTASGVAALRYDCAKPPASAYHGGWVWMRVADVGKISALRRHWLLLIDQSRFDKIAVITTRTDGSVQRIVRDADELGHNWAVGGMMQFAMDMPGNTYRSIEVGFLRLDDLSLTRKLSAADRDSAETLFAGWQILMGVFAGALLASFCYNLLIYTGHRRAFQRLYLIWTASALAYGLSWTNMLTFLAPGFVGPVAVRSEYVMVSVLIAAGHVFFLSVMENGVLPRWLSRAGWIISALVVAMGVVASADWLFPPILVDRWLNYVIIVNAALVGVGIGYAIRRRSRVVWFYLAGWTPVLSVFVMRVARNMGLLPQDDRIDMATFAALTFEAIALSLAIADRFRLLRKERDAAEEARQRIAIESETQRRAAETDFLSGLGNRTAFQRQLRMMADNSASAPFALVLLDVDHLKDINDRLGHDGGDALLVHIAGLLRKAGGDRSTIARIGGDEFAILAEVASKAALVPLLERLETMQGQPWTHGGRSWPISISIGSALFPRDGKTPEAIFKSADMALYQAKENGRRCHRSYDASLRAKRDRQLAFAQDAYAALDRNEFELHFQPIVDMRADAPTSFEALLRWRHPVHGLLTPAVFGDVLIEREIGAMVQERVIALGLEALSAHDTAALPTLALNFTAAHLDGPHAARRLLDRLAKAGVAANRLCIEVTEDIVLGRTVNNTVKALHALHDAGVRIALDDFGTGYASLIHLKQLPIDTLKIDRSFILGLFDADRECEEIIRAIIGLGQGLGKTVVAEGIETESQKRRILELGCTYGQGYLFGLPGALTNAGVTAGRSAAA